MFYGTKYINFQNNNKNPVKKVVVRRMGILIACVIGRINYLIRPNWMLWKNYNRLFKDSVR